MDGRTNGRTKKPYFVGPFRPKPGVEKEFNEITFYMKYLKQKKNFISSLKLKVKILISKL